MYSDDIKDLKRQKREANQNILFSFIRIYISLRTGFPGLIKERDDLVNMVSRYFESDRNESDVLRLINKCYGNYWKNLMICLNSYMIIVRKHF